MNVLVDANILLRLAEPGHAMCPPAQAAAAVLKGRGDVLCVVPQAPYEFWVVATRPLSSNGGPGRTPAAVGVETDAILAGFQLLPDTSAVFPNWRARVAAHAVSGKVAHDARPVAAMRVHGLTHLLTFNVADFARFPVTALDPAAVAAAP